MEIELDNEMEWFIRDAEEHAGPVDHVVERVPEGTRWAGTLWITPDGEWVLTGQPRSMEHNCDEMGCTSVSHVVARYTPRALERVEEGGE